VTPDQFIAKWKSAELKERAAAHSHFIDLCRMLDEPAPTDADPRGDWYAFERGATKTTGGEGWADVWKRDHFGWEYKGKRKDLNAAFVQLQQYALALENPPLLVVCDNRFRIHTNWTNSVSEVHEFALEDLRDSNVRQKLKWVFSDPERLKPGKTRQALTEDAAGEFAALAHSLRTRDGHSPIKVAHFINRLVFCMFAEDAELLPNKMFSRMLKAAKANKDSFAKHASTLFAAMASDGGLVGFEQIEWFNGGYSTTRRRSN